MWAATTRSASRWATSAAAAASPSTAPFAAWASPAVRVAGAGIGAGAGAGAFSSFAAAAPMAAAAMPVQFARVFDLPTATRSFATSAASSIDPFKPLDQFQARHIGPTADDQEAMLATLGFRDMEEFIASTIPAKVRMDRELNVGEPMAEQEALAKLKAIAKKNKLFRNFIGMGYYGTVTPGVILRNIMENPGWYTSYTPYQAEIAQGRLESLLNYQTVIADMTGLPNANASLLDEATAAAEAMSMTYEICKQKRNKFFVSDRLHPQTIDLIKTRAAGLKFELEIGDVTAADFSGQDFFGVIVQYPDTSGHVHDFEALAADAKSNGTQVVAATDLLALTLIRSPGEWGADVAIGSAQRFGVPMGFGGPHAGFLATRDDRFYISKMPGRIIGISEDSNGRPALRMALQGREQHIRRDTATSNVCTAQALLANMAACYAVYHGPDGLRDIGARVHRITGVVASALQQAGFELSSDTYFDTLTVSVPDAKAVVDAAVQRGVNLRFVNDTTVGLSCDETTSRADVEQLLAAFGVADADLDGITASTAGKSALLSSQLARSSKFLQHSVFNSYHSETNMLRYLHKLQSRDLSLTTSMISLGSCTMKLNATSEMIPVTWPEFGAMHPFVPRDQCEGYTELIETLSANLCDITGFAAMSQQPNSGANGEYAGLMVIYEYLKLTGQGHRNVCLIPTSAHGTNPASAAMAGMKVVPVKTLPDGHVDMEDLKAKAAKHSEHLAAFMITYPSTFGVFEADVREYIDIVHSHGGQVYMDGANMNAQVGFTSPGDLGADVCHLNLHKTFCIPHGGGGPGVGTIGVAEHLAPFLPGHAVVPTGGEGKNVKPKSNYAVSAAPYGSASILPITWMYITMLGSSGLRNATAAAILNANYMAERLKGAFDIKFLGSNGQCAHEFILDLNKLKKDAKKILKEHKGTIVEADVAKRLIDYGFHAPTMSWPVPGSLMVEPTESEDRAELDRFCDALLSIRREIDDVLEGRLHPTNNPLKNAPHTHRTVVNDSWDRPYSREQAAYPSSHVKHHKFWPHVGRINDVAGDRNLICSCPPMEAYLDSDGED